MTNTLLKIRARLTRWLVPASLKPLSSKFGFDRGTPIDRYWIEKFLNQNSSLIRGRTLEITDAKYTKKFGGERVTRSDVLDINPKNKKANIHGDLRSLSQIKSGTYDCIILTHVLGLIDDFSAAAAKCFRILKPGGALLFTSSCLGPILNEKVYWRFTPHSVKYIFGKYFKSKNMVIETFGNVLAGQAFWLGMAQEDLNPSQLSHNDPRFPVIVTMRAVK